MGNHYHLMINTPERNLVEGMKWLQNTYTRRFNVRHVQWGRLFGGRYKSVLVEGEGYYYERLMDYIHLNPARASLIDPEKGQGMLDYPWSSVACGYALSPRKRAKWLAAEDGLGAFGFPDTVEVRRGGQRLDGRMQPLPSPRITCLYPPSKLCIYNCRLTASCPTFEAQRSERRFGGEPSELGRGKVDIYAIRIVVTVKKMPDITGSPQRFTKKL